MSLIKELKNRGAFHDCSDEEQLSKLFGKEKLSFYCGFDPTSDSLHAGSMLPLINMRRLQQAGHKPIALVGGATGMIGDPSGKSEERNLLDQDTIEKNIAGIKKQISKFLDSSGKNAFELVRNDEWIKPLGYIEMLREVGKHFSVNVMLQKESVKSRVESREQGISYTEFSYMIIQAYDFYWLNKNKNCRLQIGGSDQWGNITCGIDLIRRLNPEGPEQVFGLTFPLLTTSTGAKFGKTEKGAVWLDPNKTSAYKFYQYWVNTSDEDALPYLKLFTEIDGDELKALEASTKDSPEKREAQKALAENLTELVHGKAEKDKAIVASRVLFGEKIENIDSKTLTEIFSDVPSTKITKENLTKLSLQDLLVETKLAQSKGAAKRLIEGGGIYINNEKKSDYKSIISSANLIEDSVMIVRSGKKNYCLVRIA